MRGKLAVIRPILLTFAFATASSCAIAPRNEARPFYDPVAVAGEPSAEAPKETSVKASPPSLPVQMPIPDRLVYRNATSGAAGKQQPDALAGKTISLAFANAPASEVARAVIRDVLALPVAVADGVAGNITLSAPEPLPAADALAMLELALAESGLALRRVKDGFLLSKLETAANEGASVGAAAIGYSVAIAPVLYAKPSDITTIIQGMISKRIVATADDARSAIILKGPQADIESAIEAIETFDTPQLTGRVFGLFKLQYADPSTVKTELAALSDASGAGAGTDIVALPRLNSLFVSARADAAFDELRGWIERLDQPSAGDERRLRYLPVLNTPAQVLAEQLDAALSGERGASTAAASSERQDAPASAVQPEFRAAAAFGGGDRASIAVDGVNNALIIRASDREYRDIAELIDRMDIPASQVLIEATIAEVTLREGLDYGVRWFFENAESRVTLSDNSAGAVSPVFPGIGYTFIETDARVAIDALASVTDVTVLSAPSIMVLNNQTAHLQVGDEVPIVTQQAQSTIDQGAPIVSTLQLRETGVILDVKPRINASNIVTLEITQEVSDVTPTTTSGIDSPTIQQRKFTSTVAVRDKTTIALGGLIRESYTDGESGVPLLKDIPGLGYAFKSRNVEKRRTELVVFLTPRIIRNDEDAKEAIRYIRREMLRLGKPAN